MKYKAGDKVRIKSIDWYNENKNENGYIDCGDALMITEKSQFCGKIVTISNVSDVIYAYEIEEDNGCYNWTDEMIEGLVEDGTALNKWTGLKVELELSKSVIGVSNVESLHGERFMSGFVKAIIPPEGYIFKDENGNVINATKIVLEKKKTEYPKTYEECCKVIGISRHDVDIDLPQPYQQNMFNLFKLLICRDAYWKIAGEEMGLGKPWEPNWEGEGWYVIVNHRGDIVTDIQWHANAILAFPTEEIRDAFYESFKELIEQCKELL